VRTRSENREASSEKRRVEWLVFVLALVAASLKAAGQTTRPVVSAVVRVGMTVEDAERSAEFYSRVLDFRKVSDDELAGEEIERLYGVFGARCRVVRMRLGEEEIELTEFMTSRGRLVPRDSRSNDRWFQHVAIVTGDMDRAYARLREQRVRYASTGPQRLPDWNPGAGGIRAFYFHDPDDHVLEVISFPTGKGDPRWQGRRELFAGIDHTAIVVEDTDKALAFYRDVLGMRVAGGGENFGTEQEHLNNVRGARLRITTLRAAAGPGVELLEYRAPRDGRAYPADARANDLFHWQTTVVADDAKGVLRRVLGRGYRAISEIEAPPVGGERGLVRDADGHAVLVIQAGMP
jgi:catechol 2,3-dioxygenase-like lactoylglutathione lyase family enzyme